ncbi:sugar transferase [Variovorax rhizosphaerae]|uniref:Sugar transferase n=1 Tax=Variovorax rhizosphaerae TaxID=1836200 RepID=A0ABU8WZ75_9BURK
MQKKASIGLASADTSSAVGKIIKRAIDIVGALTFFLIFGPLYVAVALAVWLGGGGPVHYRQTRLGRDGKPFHFYKFRSMVPDADRVLEAHLAQNPAARIEWDSFQRLENDPRILPIGRFLRKLSLDELPQFWNVLKGDMSLVGPRPCMKRQRSLYGAAWSCYTKIRPGLTGLWQVSRRNELTFAQRVELDVEYVTHWSMWMDCRILLKTVRAVILDGE